MGRGLAGVGVGWKVWVEGGGRKKGGVGAGWNGVECSRVRVEV